MGTKLDVGEHRVGNGGGHDFLVGEAGVQI